MKDFLILLKYLRPYAGLFAVAFLLMRMVGVSEEGRTALLRSGSGSLFRASGGRQGDPMVALTYE